MSEILVVDDDRDVAQSIELSLRRRGFRVMLAHSGVEALKTLRRYRPDIVILDILMPGMSGLEVCRHLRTDPNTVELPIIFLTARGQEQDRIDGLRAGADDYLSKPFNLEELILRVKAVLRRAQQDPVREQLAELVAGGLRLDCRTFEVTTEENEGILLTPTEFDLLYYLMSNAGQVFSSERLLQEVWDFPYDTGSTDLVRAHIKNLREKIESNPRAPIYLRTIPRHGYTIDA
ncbi:MAG TPA: response regulator transcription factor [Anaerolineae bacterium]|nr:response regulator transcription factor [Anaerolineae bacterium]